MSETARVTPSSVSAILSFPSSPEGLVFVIFFLVMILGQVAQRDGSYLQAGSQSEMVFREPWAMRAFIASLFGGVVLMCGVLLLHRMPLALMGAAAVITIGLFQVFGPSQITFNTQEHRYHSINHWASWPAQVRSGNWDDLDGIFVRSRHVKGSTFAVVNIAWKDNFEPPSRLGRFSKRERADLFASEISQTLGLPLVEPPQLREKKF